MLEHLTQAMYYFNVHLLYATIVAFAAWALTAVLPASATTKYWIWVATSLNFFVPLGAVFNKTFAPHLHWAQPLGAIGDFALRISHGATAQLISAVWLLGTSLMLARLALRLRAERKLQSAGPAVDGLLHPRISLPIGIGELLSESELNAVLIHEQAHARRRDNLIRLAHELAQCALWFHPLIWMTGRRLALYRELSCDESVMERARGRDLVSALAKLAEPVADKFVLQASATSHLSHRLARLEAAPWRPRFAANALLVAIFWALLAAGIFATVAHTACCFVAKA